MEGVIFGILRYACITCQRPHNFQFTQYQSEISKKNKNFIWNENGMNSFSNELYVKKN